MTKMNIMHKNLRFIVVTLWVTLLCLFALPNKAQAQSSKDIIAKNLEIIKIGNEPDTTKIYHLVDETLRLAEAEEDYKSMALCYRNFIIYLITHSKMERALEIKDRMISLWEKTGNYDAPMYDSWTNIVHSYNNNKNILLSMAELQKMHKFAADHDSHYGLARVYIAFGTFYINSYDTSMKNLNKALEHLKQIQYLDYYIYYCMAYTAIANHKWEESLGFISQMEQAADEANSDYVRQTADHMRLQVYVGIGNKAHAKECFERLNKLWKQHKIYGSMESAVVYAMIQYHCQFGNPNEVPELLKYITAEFEDLKYELEVLYYTAKGNYHKALESSEALRKLKERTLAEQQEAEMANANAFFNNQQLEEEKQQMSERYQRNMLTGVSIFAALLILWIVYLIYVLRKLRKAKAELQASHDIIVEQSEKVKASEEMKTAFIQSMSHEIRTPLNHIAGFSSLLTMEGLSPEDISESVGSIQKGVTDLTRIVDNMLQVSDIITQTGTPEMENVYLNELCSNAVANVNTYNNSKQLAMEMHAAQDYSIQSNAMYLNLVVRNLIENAVKFTDKGSVIVTLEGGESKTSPVRIVVSDTGCGIPKDKHEYVFGRFTKLDKFVPGVGVGLYLCRLMVTRLGGHIFIDPDYTEGCRVVVEFQGD